jgi:hypothetical protein
MIKKQFVIIASNKGGTGKSTFSRGYADWLRRQEGGAFLSDSDGEVGQLLQFYGTRKPDVDGKRGKVNDDQDGRSGVHYFDIKKVKQRDRLFDGIDSGADRVMVDMPGGSFEMLLAIDNEVSLFDHAIRLGYRITIANVITPMIASARTVAKMLELFSYHDGIDFLVVKNGFFGPEPDAWIIWDESKAKPALASRHGIEITMPLMRARTYARIDQHSLGFTAATTAAALQTADRSVAFGWIKAMDKAIEAAGAVL